MPADFFTLENPLVTNKLFETNSCHFRRLVFPVDMGQQHSTLLDAELQSLLALFSQFQDIIKTSLYGFFCFVCTPFNTTGHNHYQSLTCVKLRLKIVFG